MPLTTIIHRCPPLFRPINVAGASPSFANFGKNEKSYCVQHSKSWGYPSFGQILLKETILCAALQEFHKKGYAIGG